MKTIAFYLPQFHCIPENDKWWGTGFTEWVNVKKAKQLYKGHYQPRVPLNDNYYNLLDIDTMCWQVDLAKSYGLYGFCFYHYWFSGKRLLEKPVEMYLAHKELDLPFCICWANENWTDGWAAKTPRILIGQEEGDQIKWKEHFEYWIPFFKDERYIRKDGKPILVIYKPDLFPHMSDMLDYWDYLAMQNGLPGLIFISQLFPRNMDETRFDYVIEYQPTCTYVEITRPKNRYVKNIKEVIKKVAQQYCSLDLEGLKLQKLQRYDYDEIWKKILMRPVISEKCIPGAFVDWDNTARKSERGYVIEGATPKKFYHFFKQQIINAKTNYKKDMIFLFAWNEWAESGYLEPDAKFRYGYLESMKRALEETGEIEK